MRSETLENRGGKYGTLISLQRHTEGNIRPFSFGRHSSASSSEVGRRHVGAGFTATFPSDGPVSLLPQRYAIAGADLLGVLEKACGAGDDAAAQPGEKCLSGMTEVAVRHRW